LLVEAMALAPKSVDLADREQSLYVTQLFNQLGIIESFVGYKKRAIDIYKKEIELIEAGKPMYRRSWLKAKLNLLSVESELDGATGEDLDALLQFNPFYFVLDMGFEAGLIPRRVELEFLR